MSGKAAAVDVPSGLQFSGWQKCPKNGYNSTCLSEGLLTWVSPQQRWEAPTFMLSFNPQIVTPGPFMLDTVSGTEDTATDEADTVPTLGFHQTQVHILRVTN